MNIPIVGEVNISKYWSVIMALLALGYVVSPIDAIPDFIPVIGWLDDLVVLLIGGAPLVKSLMEK